MREGGLRVGWRGLRPVMFGGSAASVGALGLLMPRVARRLHRYEALAGHPSLGPAVARLLHQRLEALGGQKGVAAHGELLRRPLTVLTPDNARRYAAVAAWPLLQRCHDSRRSVPTWERLGLTLCRRVVPKMFP